MKVNKLICDETMDHVKSTNYQYYYPLKKFSVYSRQIIVLGKWHLLYSNKCTPCLALAIVYCIAISTDVTMGACEYDGMMYYNGETFMEDLCTVCQCNDGTVTCTTETCPDCEQGATAANISNQCCPKCLQILIVKNLHMNTMAQAKLNSKVHAGATH